MDMQSKVEEFLAAAHRAAREFRLMSCSSGNLSWRIDDERVLISASRSWLSELRAEQVSVMRLEDGTVLSGPTPSVESRFHLGILRNRPEMNVVLHFQSPAATTFCCRDTGGLNFYILPEIPFYIGSVGQVPYRMPGSPELADEVIEKMKRHNLLLLHNHGQVTVGKTLDLAIQNAVFFELNCQVMLQGGQALSEAAVRQLREASSV